ncbi:MAG TPA: hypothetical protein VHU80_25295 [Polyangiaceae bacterium]|jgi:hypothetical protein|nr:hypothetical protein [Polyangiaceae bacterium]
MNRPASREHDETTLAARSRPLSRVDVLLVVAALTPPAAWAVSLGLSYMLVYPVVRSGSKAPLLCVTVAAATLSVASATVAVRVLRDVARVLPPPKNSIRIRALAFTACALSAFFLVAIAAQAIPIVLLGPR